MPREHLLPGDGELLREHLRTLHAREAHPAADDEPAETDVDLQTDPDAGATTAEYAVLTLAAVAFAGVLAVVVRSGPVQSLLQGIIERALTP